MKSQESQESQESQKLQSGNSVNSPPSPLALRNLKCTDFRTEDYSVLRERSVENFKEYWGLSVHDLKQLVDPKDRFWSHYKSEQLLEDQTERSERSERLERSEGVIEELSESFDKYFSYKHELKQIDDIIKTLSADLKRKKESKDDDTNTGSSIDTVSEEIRRWSNRRDKVCEIKRLPRKDKAILFRFHEVCIDGNNGVQYYHDIYRKVRFIWFTHVLYDHGRRVLKKIKSSLNIEEMMKTPINNNLKGYFHTFGVIISQVYTVSDRTRITFDYPVVKTVLRSLQQKQTTHQTTLK